MAAKTQNLQERKPANASGNIAASYNKVKDFKGQRYTGMKVGRSHKWYYDAGVWKETKVTPEEWRISYAVTKRRAGKAPEGSGVPVGTEYDWYILAHQNVKKLNANDYSTSMDGLKFKLAHKRADSEKWSASEAARRKHLIKILKQMIHDLEHEPAANETPAAALASPSPQNEKKPARVRGRAMIGAHQRQSENRGLRKSR